MIRSLRPNVSREEAVAHFSPRGFSGLISPFSGRLRAVGEFFIPFRVFELSIVNGGRTEHKILAIDSVTGALMPYVFRAPLAANEIIEVESRNHVTPHLAEADSRRIAETRCQRLLFASGFFRIRDLKITAQLLTEIHVPYWIGFRGNGEFARFAVLDAMRRRTEGAKVRQIVRNWLISGENSQPQSRPETALSATKF